jgi:hypothetical protein
MDEAGAVLPRRRALEYAGRIMAKQSKNQPGGEPPSGERKPLPLPGGHDKVLLHSCCAPCSGEVMEAMQASGIDYTIFFYNPNIHPLKEYELRKSENVRFAEKHGIAFIDADYDRDNWFARAKGLEMEPERGVRCTMCFDMRFERTALYAHENGFRSSPARSASRAGRTCSRSTRAACARPRSIPDSATGNTTGARAAARPA